MFPRQDHPSKKVNQVLGLGRCELKRSSAITAEHRITGSHPAIPKLKSQHTWLRAGDFVRCAARGVIIGEHAQSWS